MSAKMTREDQEALDLMVSELEESTSIVDAIRGSRRLVKAYAVHGPWWAASLMVLMWILVVVFSPFLLLETIRSTKP